MRYTRQELKQDKFKETAQGAAHWTVEHRSTLTTATIAVALVAILVVGGFWFMKYRGDQANAALGAAMAINNAPIAPKDAAPPQITTYPTLQERAAAAKVAFYNVSSSYGSTHAGKLAKYMAGLNEVELGNSKVAEQDLKDVVSSSDSSVSSLAKLALAALYRDTNRESDAIATYKDLMDHPTDSVPKVQAQMELADLYSSKQPEEAKKIYAQVTKDYKDSLAAQLAQQRLSSLK